VRRVLLLCGRRWRGHMGALHMRGVLLLLLCGRRIVGGSFVAVRRRRGRTVSTAHGWLWLRGRVVMAAMVNRVSR
jgi:hypothetical protein